MARTYVRRLYYGDICVSSVPPPPLVGVAVERGNIKARGEERRWRRWRELCGRKNTGRRDAFEITVERSYIHTGGTLNGPGKERLTRIGHMVRLLVVSVSFSASPRGPRAELYAAGSLKLPARTGTGS